MKMKQHTVGACSCYSAAAMTQWCTRSQSDDRSDRLNRMQTSQRTAPMAVAQFTQCKCVVALAMLYVSIFKSNADGTNSAKTRSGMIQTRA